MVSQIPQKLKLSKIIFSENHCLSLDRQWIIRPGLGYLRKKPYSGAEKISQSNSFPYPDSGFSPHFAEPRIRLCKDQQSNARFHGATNEATIDVCIEPAYQVIF